MFSSRVRGGGGRMENTGVNQSNQFDAKGPFLGVRCQADQSRGVLLREKAGRG